MKLFKSADLIRKSKYISRDLSWLRFNYRVLDQAKDPSRTLFDRLRFMSITCSNLDEFFMIRLGSLYNYIDYGKERIDYSGLREMPFRRKLLDFAHRFVNDQSLTYLNELKPQFEKNGFNILRMDELTELELKKADGYFKNTLFPLLTPMVYDSYHGFPLMMNQMLILGVVTRTEAEGEKGQERLTFVQIPQNLSRFFELTRKDKVIFVPIEEIVRANLPKLFRNVDIESANLFRITRNGDFTLEESDDIDVDFIKEIQVGLKTRKKGRVVRLEVEKDASPVLMAVLKERWKIDNGNVFVINSMIDMKGLLQILKHPNFRGKAARQPAPVAPLSLPEGAEDNMFEYLKHHDVLLHHPYNSIDPVVRLLERAAEDPHVLGIKQTIYRLADDSRVTAALLKAAENGKHVSVLFEVKARFDEERNIREGARLEKAGCFVIYGVSKYKTHTKMLMIIRKEGEKVTRYVHLGSGNYNEQTSRIYTDVSLLTTNDVYGHDVSEFFNVITGHSQPDDYEYLITAPKDMRQQLIHLIREEIRNAKKGLPSGIVMKMNSLEDKEMIDEFYKASKAGVPIRFIVRGICCLRPGRAGLSDNIEVRSIVGDYLEHSRMFYFHHGGQPKVYAGSADLMVRSFDRRIEALFLIVNPALKREAINILYFNLKDNQNTYLMREDGAYVRRIPAPDEPVFNVHKEFYHRHYAAVSESSLYDEWLTRADVQTDNAASNEGPPLTAPDFPTDAEMEDAEMEAELATFNSTTEEDLPGGESPQDV
ncbi:RNA degradosome polyphosphate kinase [Hymenobacter qilianensis]|uniref:RNA degradosome polyphosphate kinase n=2 Tax=Hymenobacter qilianensis TaxID=1385715 RepID=A0ACB5PR34_9BACT|nr:polyphosphate kinase 1 [Hymenobacter qilianensis]QNP52049.1 polyphosphate kinase 1 [Hymenobacter qilianensis]GGF64106.1 RNA degradosome polyphosphate kinase [Hymenobacter qilianensis]